MRAPRLTERGFVAFFSDLRLIPKITDSKYKR
jgi:hypothetical protein